MDYCQIMHEAAKTFNDRNPKYGDMRAGMDRVADIATLITGIHLTSHDVALVLHAVKLSRLNNDRSNPDHYIDGVNYLAFAGELIQPVEVAQVSTSPVNIQSLEDGIADIASRYAADREASGL
jgi:hypothetical protein